MKLLRMKLANWLTNGGYLAACRAATHWEDRYQDMSGKAVKLEQALTTERELSAANNRRINDLATANTRMSEALDQIVRAGEGKIEGRKCNGSLKRVVRMAEGALYPQTTCGTRLIAAAHEARGKVQQETVQ